MPQPIYLPRHPTFMEQFLKTGAVDNIMRSIMMGVQNRRQDEDTARGLKKEGYTEVQPVPESQQEAAPQTPEEQAAFESGPRGEYWKKHAPPDVTVGNDRGFGPFRSPERGFRKPVEPKMTFGIEKGEGGRDWAIVRKGDKIVKVDRVKSEKDKDTRTSMRKDYEYALQQHSKGLADHPGSFSTWRRAQKRAGATRITMGEKVRTNKAIQISKMQTGIRSPKFREAARAYVMKGEDADLFSPEKIEEKTREEMLKRISELYPGKKVTFEKRKRKDGSEFLGFYIDGKLERLAE